MERLCRVGVEIVLWSRADGLHGGLIGWHSVSGDEEVVVVHVAVHASCDFGGFGAEGGASALQEDHDDDPAHAGVGVGSEPAEAGAFMRARPGLAEDLFFVEIHAQAACSAVMDSAGHAVSQFRNDWGDIELALYARLETGDLLWIRGMLQVIESSAVGDRRNHRTELQRGHGDAFTERAHLANAAQALR